MAGHSYSFGDQGFSLGRRRMASTSIPLATQCTSRGGEEVQGWWALTWWWGADACIPRCGSSVWERWGVP